MLRVAASILLALVVTGVASGQTRVRTAGEAAADALTDFRRLNGFDRQFVRYMWRPPWIEDESHIAFTVNSVSSKVRQLIRPVKISRDVYRWNLRQLSIKGIDRRGTITVWDEIFREDVRFFDSRGNPLFSPAGLGIRGNFQNLPRRFIVSSDWFTVASLSSIDGGRYYDLLGLVDRAGVNRVSGRGGQIRALTFKSNVTGKTRITVLKGGSHFQYSTLDFKDQTNNPNDTRRDKAAQYNLDNPDFDAEELIWELPNGLLGYGIFAGGRLAKEVTSDIAVNHIAERGINTRINSGISCIQCHGFESGLRDVQNDYDALSRVVTSSAQTDVLYRQDVDRFLEVGRGRYERTVRLLTGKTAPEVAKAVSDIYEGYKRVVSPKRALLEMGLRVETNRDAARILRSVLRPVGREDPTVAALMAGLKVQAVDFRREFQSMLRRLRQ